MPPQPAYSDQESSQWGQGPSYDDSAPEDGDYDGADDLPQSGPGFAPNVDWRSSDNNYVGTTQSGAEYAPGSNLNPSYNSTQSGTGYAPNLNYDPSNLAYGLSNLTIDPSNPNNYSTQSGTGYAPNLSYSNPYNSTQYGTETVPTPNYDNSYTQTPYGTAFTASVNYGGANMSAQSGSGGSDDYQSGRYYPRR